MASRDQPQPHQRLWVVRYGTMSQMVWAGSAEVAEQKVRVGLIDARATPYDLRCLRERIRGEMTVWEADKDTVAAWHECGGRPIHWEVARG